MALDKKSDLADKVVKWLKRSGNASFVAEVPDIIELAEARLNRELGPVETDITRTGTVNSRSISISSMSVAEPIALWITDPGSSDEREMQMQGAGNIPIIGTSGKPVIWCMDGEASIKFERPCDQQYGFRFHFKQRFALEGDDDTNWLLDNHPDLYLAASLLWGASFLEWGEHAAAWKTVLDRGIQEVRRELGARKVGKMRVDHTLLAMGGSSRGRFGR